MGYYVRVLSTSDESVSIETLQKALRNNGCKAELKLEAGTKSNWTQIVLCHLNGTEIAAIERNDAAPDSLGAEELAEFSAEIENCKPAAAAAWLNKFFKRVKCIYAFQILSGTDTDNGWDILETVKSAIWQIAPGIFQADSEGFSNETGHHILWQFSDSVTGNRQMAVLKNEKWISFQMDLGNKSHRTAFLNGTIPSDLANGLGNSFFSRLKNLFSGS